MEYIKRKSNSTEIPSLVIYLQGGILIRFNIVENTNSEDTITFDYDEFWFSLDSDINYIETEVGKYGLELTNEHKALI